MGIGWKWHWSWCCYASATNKSKDNEYQIGPSFHYDRNGAKYFSVLSRSLFPTFLTNTQCTGDDVVALVRCSTSALVDGGGALIGCSIGALVDSIEAFILGNIVQ